MRLSFSTMGTPEKNGVEASALAAQYGYHGVDLRVTEKKGELTIHVTSTEIQELKNAFAYYGVNISSLFCYNETATEEPDSWAVMYDSILKHAEIANSLGTSAIRIFGGNPKKVNDKDSYINKTAEMILSVLNRTGKDIIILMQNHVGSFQVKDVILLNKYIDNPKFAMAFDPSHSIKMGENSLDEYYDDIVRISKALYITDIKKQDGDFINVPPGQGEVGIKEILYKLGGYSFDGWVTFKWPKIWIEQLEEPEQILPYFINFINKLMSD